MLQAAYAGDWLERGPENPAGPPPVPAPMMQNEKHVKRVSNMHFKCFFSVIVGGHNIKAAIVGAEGAGTNGIIRKTDW